MLERPPPEVKGLFRKRCTIWKRLDGKVAIVTGASCGLGETTAAELARRGCHVIMACRELSRAEAAKLRILNKYGEENVNCVKVDIAESSMSHLLTPVRPAQLQIEHLDLASLASVREFARRILETESRLDILIENAGILSTSFRLSEDGYELTMATNYLGHFLLTTLLESLLVQSAPSRVIIVSSAMHYSGEMRQPNIFLTESHYRRFKAYSDSKLANVMHAMELSRRLEKSGVCVVSLHPGLVKSEIVRDCSHWEKRITNWIPSIIRIEPWVGAQTILFAVLKAHPVSGGYYSNCSLKTPNRLAWDPNKRSELWNYTCDLLGIKTQ